MVLPRHQRPDAELIRRWKAETAQPAQAASVEADRLTGDAVREAGAADGHRVDGDRAMGRSREWEAAATDLAGPSEEDLAWAARQEQQRDESVAHDQWDPAERRGEFAASLQGLADQTAVDAGAPEQQRCPQGPADEGEPVNPQQ